MSDYEPLPFRQRNGLLQACDACRKRKVACDHAFPRCGRCSRLKSSEVCVYSEARTTSKRIKTRKVHQPRVQNNSLSNYTRSEDQGEISPTSPLQKTTISSIASVNEVEAVSIVEDEGPSLQTYSATSQRSPTLPIPIASAKRESRLGFTSFSTVYEEALQELPIDDSHKDSSVSMWTIRHTNISKAPADILQGLEREKAFFVLRNIPKVSHAKFQPPSRWYSDEWSLDLAINALRHCQLLMRGCKGLQNERDLEQAAMLLTQNTTHQLNDEYSDSRAWMEQFLGKNLRWESIGLIFACPNFVIDNKAEKLHVKSMENIRRKTRLLCLGYCIDLARSYCDASLLLLQLCRIREVEMSVFAGDADLSTWNCHGTSATLCTYLGYHNIGYNLAYPATFCREMKRRLYAHIFISDKAIVLFTGRPPLLSRHYATTLLPLDIGDKDLLAGGQVLESAMKALDSNGWNTTGQVYTTTMLRARMIFAMIRDELIEYALRPSQDLQIKEIVSTVKQQQIDASRSLPRYLDYDPDHINDSTVPLKSLYIRLKIDMEHLQNLFLAERLLFRAGQGKREDLILVAYQLVTRTLTLWLHKDQLSSYRADFQWLVMMYGAPSGGVLCMELLQPSFVGKHPADAQITRSSIVQQLSMLSVFLGWVDHTAPNAGLCQGCQAVIQKVLNHTLNTDSLPSESNDAEPRQNLNSMLEGVHFEFDLMNTFDWVVPEPDMDVAPVLADVEFSV